MYELLVFDWDGTIVDSAARIVSSIRRASEDLRIETPSDHAIRETIGLGLYEALAVLFPSLPSPDIERMRQRYAYYYMEADDTPVLLFPGVQASLGRLRNKGFRLAIATGKGRPGLDLALSQTGLESFFEISRCASETKSKPDPLMLNEILEASKVPAAQVLMIGDTEYDMDMAVRAGVAAVAVGYGAHPVSRLRSYSPLFEMDTFPDLEYWLNSIR